MKKGGASAGKKSKNTRSKPSHPPTAEMVTNAIRSLKERGGSSLQAIKKYASANYKIDAEKMSPFIKKYIRSAVAAGALVQTKGKGASGSFKLSSATATGKQAAAATEKPASALGKAKKRAAAKKAGAAAAAASVKSPAPKAAASTSPKKVPVVPPKRASSSKEPARSPSKAKKTGGPTKKPKAPKPKRAKTAAAKSSKKGSAGTSPKKR